MTGARVLGADPAVLDDGPLQVLAKVVDLPTFRSWPSGMFAVSQPTFDAFVNAPDNWQREFVASAGLLVVDIGMGQVNASTMLWNHLRRDYLAGDRADLAEHIAIAWIAQVCPHSKLVTNDQAAFFLAALELGSHRVLHPCDVWDWLHEQGLFTLEQRDRATAMVARNSNLNVPFRHS
jgi:hypothetical protein